MLPVSDLSRALEALQCIPADSPRSEWVRVLMAAHAASVPEDEAKAWSAQAGSFNARDFRDTWRSIKPGGGITAGTLFKLAAEHGYGKRRSPTPTHTRSGTAKTAQEPRTAPRPGEEPSVVWNRCLAAPADHPYIVAKAGLPDGLRVLPAGDPLRIAGECMAGALVVPVQRRNGSISSLQFIASGDVAARLKAAGKPSKLNLPGASLEGAWLVGTITPTLYLCEGIGQAWAVWKATGSGALVCFGWGRVRAVGKELREVHPKSRLVLVPDVGKEGDAEAIARELRADVAAMPEGWPQNADVNDYAKQEGHDALEVLLSHAKAPEAEPLPFSLVPIADLATAAPTPPVFVWDGLVPSGHVTLFAAHGGTGKSYLALMLAVAVALGLPLFGIPTRRGIVAFYSGEDGAHVLRDRLARVCMGMGVAVERLEGRLFILDATDEDPTLFAEVTTAGRKEGTTTQTYSSLRDFIAEKDVSFLVVDNASDAFDASEIDRARVRGFMRSLARIARERDAGVLLLAHVDKGTSRKERSDTEGYSGSTAWNNSARSRLFMTREEDGGLLLQHQKHNLGKLREPLRLVWPEGGIPALDVAFGPVVQGIADRGHEKALLKLIAEFAERGEHVTTATTSRTNAAKLLRHEPGFPRVKDGEVFNLLRKAERAGYLERITYKGPDRKDRERWEVTETGRAFAGLPAATAATAATPEATAPSAEPAKPAATAATSPPRGVGGNTRTSDGVADAG